MDKIQEERKFIKSYKQIIHSLWINMGIYLGKIRVYIKKSEKSTIFSHILLVDMWKRVNIG